ncbi:hypothetical protein G7B40_012475 [Aetokthonos hydrillicola Thurmond2011]|uniref:Uncharacterized protein n=1 Tax=Aetokthonos hydrillicola Thurmond2011 TaxID=2712845 RepID=A0AAP5I877_9CYAN|nr:hypothetical protein [Aetokthonos hydrillicola]MBW4584830.1 hypothetical protein [Aetokthonos hydrillicola CCALA 1050]MDR9895377.1 hypothetical protein [Aetokthonos hydrillicola Thurmond2011]
MTTYIFFDDALRMLVQAFLGSIFLLIAVSGIGLAVIETIEKTNVGVDAKRLPGG